MEIKGLAAVRDSLREQIIARAKASATLLEGYLKLGGSLADFSAEWPELFKNVTPSATKPKLRVVKDDESEAVEPAKAKKGGKKKGSKKGGKKSSKKAPPREDAKGGDAAAKVLEVLKNAESPLAVSDVAAAMGMTSKETAVVLKALRDEKKVKATGKARGTRWALK